MPLQTTLKEQWPEILSTLTGILTLYLQWFSIDAESIACTDIAMKWGSGHYQEAVNAFWSPLWSWLLIPFLRVLGHPHICIRLLQFVLLLIALRCWKKWIAKLAHPENKFSPLLRMLGGINLACFSQSVSGPNFLACILCLEFIRKLIFQKPSFIVLGFWLALLFYTRTGLLLFGLAAYSGIHIYQVSTKNADDSRLKKILKPLAVLLLTAGFIFPWVQALHNKYGQWMLSSEPKYTHTYKFAGGVEHSWKECGLVAPPDGFSTFAWTDITKSTNNFRQFIHQNNKSYTAIITYNVLKTIRLLIINAGGGIIAVIMLWRFRKELPEEVKLRFYFGSALSLLYTGGIIFFPLEEGDLQPVFMVLTGLIVCLPGALLPIKNRFFYGIVLSIIVLANSTVNMVVRQGYSEHKLAKTTAGIIPKGAHIASFRTGQTWAISFFNRYRDYGGIQHQADSNLQSALDSFDIRYVIVPSADLLQTKKRLEKTKLRQLPIAAGSWYVLKIN
jgi:hypothetical protein